MPNQINPLIIRMVACLAGLSFLFMGCGEKTEPQKPKVFAQKITEDKTTPGQQEPPSSQAKVAKAAAPPPQAKVPVTPVANPLPEGSRSADTGAGTKGPVASSEAPEADLASETAYAYNPKGKIDPFMPFYGDEQPTAKRSADKRIPLSPLEKVDLSQLKLVGIILSDSGNSALVEESTGKGFVIAEGTYIGLNRGKVSRILRDRVIIEEAIQYGMSEASVRRKELKLQKPPGDN